MERKEAETWDGRKTPGTVSWSYRSSGTEDQYLLGVHTVSPASREKADGLGTGAV